MKPVAAVPTADVAEHESSPRRSRADLAEYTWIGVVIGASLVRFVIAWGAFGEHGANPWVFGVIDIGTAYPYAKSIALVVRRIADSDFRGLPAPLAVALASFFAPYVYIWFAAGEMPAGLRMGMVLCVSVLAIAATLGVLAKARRLRREGFEAEESIVIDVRDESASSEPASRDAAGSEPVVVQMSAAEANATVDVVEDSVASADAVVNAETIDPVATPLGLTPPIPT